MKNRIIVIATLKLVEGQLALLEETLQELKEHCMKTEKGMLQYDWYLSEDEEVIKVLETYVDSEAVLFHFDNYKPFAPKLAQAREFVSLEIFGEASESLRQRVKKINAVHYKVVSSLNKLSYPN